MVAKFKPLCHCREQLEGRQRKHDNEGILQGYESVGLVDGNLKAAFAIKRAEFSLA